MAQLQASPPGGLGLCIVEELRRHLEQEKDRLAEQVFHSMLKSGELRFLVISNKLKFSFPKKLDVKPSVKTLTRKDGSQLQLSLFEFLPEFE